MMLTRVKTENDGERCTRLASRWKDFGRCPQLKWFTGLQSTRKYRMPPWTAGDRDTGINTLHNIARLCQGGGIIVLIDHADPYVRTFFFRLKLYTQFPLPAQYISGEFLSDSLQNVWFPHQNTISVTICERCIGSTVYTGIVCVYIYLDGGVSDVRVQDLL
jgi:hypothetical protein